MKKYLLEIGVEELPYKFIPQATKQLEKLFSELLEENCLDYREIKVLATPRRLAVLIEGLVETQQDSSKEIKGPPLSVSYDKDGNLTPAGIGFAKKNNVDITQLITKDSYIYAIVQQKGLSVEEIFKNNVEKIIFKIQGAHFMRWASNNEKFSRPIRWIVSLLNEQELKIKVLDIESSRISRGHRFSQNKAVEIKSPESYEEQLISANVIVDPKKREKLIVESVEARAKKAGADAKIDSNLLEEVVYLCEWPLAVLCDFKEEYLSIPEVVTVTVMAVHQRYFPLYKNGKLLNSFITIANFVGEEHPNIKAGNQRVITARLDDAVFFFKEDTKEPLFEKIEALKGMTFQKNMGSMYDKTQRIVNLSSYLAKELNVEDDDIKRCALLCKADLSTSLVFEFTELQGFIGSDYARLSGENENVCLGIKEHYYPLNAECESAKSLCGQIVGIADKIDTICSVFKMGKKPSGSYDPLGIRRAVLGILRTILDNSLNIDLSSLIDESLKLIGAEETQIKNEIEEFFINRFVILLENKYKNDILEAACYIDPLKDPLDFIKRLDILTSLYYKEGFSGLVEGAKRVSRICKVSTTNPVNPELFIEKEEKDLFDSINKIKTENYEELKNTLMDSIPFISAFFDKVLVMAQDEKIKENRLSLLKLLKQKFDLLCNFDKIVF